MQLACDKEFGSNGKATLNFEIKSLCKHTTKNITVLLYTH